MGAQKKSLLEELIRTGQSEIAIQELNTLISLSFSRIEALVLSEFSRRLGVPTWGLKILKKNLPKGEVFFSWASNEELVEYSQVLTQLGANEGSEKILSRLDPNSDPNIPFYRALNQFGKWSYENSIPFLEEFIQRTEDEYKKIVGQVNLAAALITTGQFDEGQMKIRDLLKTISKNNQKILYGNLHELLAQSQIANNDFTKARQSLFVAENCLKNTGGNYFHFVEKWKLIVDLLESPNFTNLKRVRNFQKEAGKQERWESVRDLDYHLGRATQLNRIKEIVYFGTPFESFRNRFETEGFHPSITMIPAPLNNYKKSSKESFDTLTGAFQNQQIVKPGTQIHRLLLSLCSDIYKPFSVGRLFELIFPDEIFDPLSSMNRVSQLLSRLRKISNSPFQIDIENARFRLITDTPFQFHITNNDELLSQDWESHIYIGILKKRFGIDYFTGLEAMNVLLLSKPKFLSFLKPLVESLVIIKNGSGKNTKYKLNKMTKSVPSGQSYLF